MEKQEHRTKSQCQYQLVVISKSNNDSNDKSIIPVMSHKFQLMIG